MTTIFTTLTGGNGCSILSATPGPDLTAHGYAETEYAAAGSVPGIAPGGTVDPADFVTRILVRRPRDGRDFNGTLVVEWLNVSSGNDAAPEYTYLAAELIRQGYAWVGVSAQYVGIAGGTGSVGVGVDPQSLAAKDPDRYGMLSHPGDAYCYDIYAWLGEALRANSRDDHPLAGLPIHEVLAVGESQSAMALTTYVNRFGDSHGLFDGYLIHSRAAAGLPLGEVGSGIDVTTTFLGAPEITRDDVAPVFVLQTETDVLTNFRYHLVRQPDSDRIRAWEIAGAAHADLHQVGPFEEYLGCPNPVNRGQQRFVLRAGLHHLRSWVLEESAPPTAEPLALHHPDGAQDPEFVLDDLGNVVGGVRTPCVDAATQVLSGVVPDPVSRICMLFGSTETLAPDLLAARYGTRDEYEKHYRTATEAAIDAGHVLAADREELLADANPDLIP